MKYQIIGSAAVWIGLVGAAAWSVCPAAGTAAPATRPASPASAPAGQTLADLSSPLAAMRTFTFALNRGNPEVLRQVLYADDERTREYVDAMIETAVSLERIRQATIEVLGQEAGQNVHSPYGPNLTAGDPIAGATAEMQGNRASVHFHDRLIPFQKVQGHWRLAVGRMEILFRYPSFPTRWRRVAAAWTALAGQIKAGKYKTLDEVENAMKAEQARVDNAASGGQYGPATQALNAEKPRSPAHVSESR